MNIKDIIDILLNIIFIATFICIFFFTYAKHIEENIVKKQIQTVADDIAYNISFLIDKDIANKINNNIKSPDFTNEDKQVDENNIALEKKAFLIIGVVFIIGLIIVITLIKIYNLDFKNIFFNNFIILLFVGLTEFLFLTFIAQNYITLDSNYVRKKLLISLKEKLNK